MNKFKQSFSLTWQNNFLEYQIQILIIKWINSKLVSNIFHPSNQFYFQCLSKSSEDIFHNKFHRTFIFKGKTIKKSIENDKIYGANFQSFNFVTITFLKIEICHIHLGKHSLKETSIWLQDMKLMLLLSKKIL